MQPRSHTLILVSAVCAAWVAHAAPPAQPAPSGEITVWCMGAEGTRIPELARDFEAEHPGTRVVTEAVPWAGAHDRLITAVAGNSTPDVTQLGTTWVPEFAAMGALETLDGRVGGGEGGGTDVRADAFFDGSMATARWEGRTCAIPWYVDTRVVFYRTDILAKAGWDHYPTTWDEFEQMAGALTRDLDGDGRTDQYAVNLSARDETILLNYVWQAGGRVMNDSLTRAEFDTPETREGVAFYQSIFSRGFSPPGESAQIDQFQAFRDGYFLSWVTGPWMVGEIERRVPELHGRWAVAKVPGRRTRTSFLGGCNLAVFKGARNPELAWAFIAYLSRPDVQRKWYRITGDLPAVRAAWKSDELAGNPMWSVFRAQLDEARPAPAIECWEAMAEIVKNEMEDLAIGNADAGATVARMQKGFEEILARRRTGEGNLGRTGGGWFLAAGLALAAALAVAGWRGRRALAGWRRWRTPAVFLAPVFAHLGVFVVLPIAVSFALSFTDYDIYSIGDWRRTSAVGIGNYTRLFGDPLFWRSVVNTTYFVVLAGPLTIALGLGAALALNRRGMPLRGFFRTANFLPVVTPLIAVAVVWRWMYSPRHGLLNAALEWLGLPAQTWLADPTLAMPCLIVLAVWKNFGYSMVIFLAGLQAIPPSLYEAAEIDGASARARFLHITLPMLQPTTVFVTIITTIGYMQFFAEPYVMTEMGGPQNRTLSIVLYLYKEGFRFFHLGYASAMAYTLCAAIAVLTLAQLRWARGAESAA